MVSQSRARKDFEKTTGKKVVTNENYLPPNEQKQLKDKNNKEV